MVLLLLRVMSLTSQRPRCTQEDSMRRLMNYILFFLLRCFPLTSHFSFENSCCLNRFSEESQEICQPSPGSIPLFLQKIIFSPHICISSEVALQSDEVASKSAKSSNVKDFVHWCLFYWYQWVKAGFTSPHWIISQISLLWGWRLLQSSAIIIPPFVHTAPSFW